MEHLKKISNQIDRLKSNPDNLDVDFIITLLSESYTIAMDGLNRSLDANKYKELKKDYDTMVLGLSESNNRKDSLMIEVEKLKEFKESLSPIYEKLKSQCIGKIKLIDSYSPELKQKLINKIESNSKEFFNEVYDRVNNDFNNEWTKESTKVINNESKSLNNKPVNYKSIKL